MKKNETVVTEKGNKFFRKPIILLWSGQGLSSLGSGIYLSALAWYVIQLTNSALSMGILLFVGILPKLLFSMIGGALSDRFIKKKILVYCDTVRFVITLVWGLSLLYRDATIVELYVMTLLFAIIDSFFNPVYSSLIPELISKSNVSRAVAINQLVFRTVGIASPALGGILISVTSFDKIVLFNACAFLIATVTNVMLPNTGKTDRKKGNSLLFNIKQGINYFYNNKVVFWSVILITFANIAVVSYNVNLSKLVQVDNGWSSYAYGTVLSCYSLGAVLVILLLSFVKIKRNYGLLYIITLLIGGGSFSFVAFCQHPYQLCIVFFVIGGSFAVTSNISTTILYEATEESYRGRIMGIASISSLLSPIGYLLWGIVGDGAGSEQAFLIASIIIVLVGIGGLFTTLVKYQRGHVSSEGKTSSV